MSAIRDLYKKYIAHTGPKALTPTKKLYLCNVRRTSGKIMRRRKRSTNRRVYISTKALKHVYDRHIFDKHTPEDFLLILENLTDIIKRPDRIYRNNPDKRGDFLLVKNIHQRTYLISVEIVVNKEDTSIEIVSASFTRERYLKKFNLLWSGRTANPPS